MPREIREVVKVAAFTMVLVPALISFSSGQTSHRSTDALAREADVVAVGKVTATKPEWDRGRSRIVTRVTVAIGEYMKGGAGNVITLTTPGGEVDGVGEWYSHSARFVADEDVVVFAGRDAEGGFRIHGGPEGKITITKDELSGKARVGGQMTLDEFRARIKAAVQEQQME